MKTLSKIDAVQWSRDRNIETNRQAAELLAAGAYKVRFATPKNASMHAAFCRVIESTLKPWTHCLFWVTEWGIWPSSENWQLYYRLRESYGDHRLIDERPAHLFQAFENHDLVSFLQIGLAAGWDFCLLTHEDAVRVFVSHDEWIEFEMKDKADLDALTAEISKFGLPRA